MTAPSDGGPSLAVNRNTQALADERSYRALINELDAADVIYDRVTRPATDAHQVAYDAAYAAYDERQGKA